MSQLGRLAYPRRPDEGEHVSVAVDEFVELTRDERTRAIVLKYELRTRLEPPQRPVDGALADRYCSDAVEVRAECGNGRTVGPNRTFNRCRVSCGRKR
jgi:hypothetical protein